MKTKLIGIFVCMLLVGTVLPVTGNVIVDKTTSSNISGDTLYVGGIGEGNYTHIQDAINDSIDRDTVFVFDDSSPYYELLVINKSINLIGEDRDTTVIDGHENDEGEAGIIHIKADGVIVQGFTIQNSSLKHGNESEFHYGIEIISDNNIIKDNVIVDNFYGIQIGSISPTVYSYNNVIENNIINFNINIGLSLDFAFNNKISGNLISSNGDHGIYSFYDCSSNLISYNNISSHTYTGIFVNGHNNVIKSNNIINHNTGVLIVYSIKNQVLKNNIYNNEKNAEIHVALLALLKHMWSNKWDGNYWGKTQILPKMIIGRLYVLRIPLVTFDWHPAKQPYDI